MEIQVGEWTFRLVGRVYRAEPFFVVRENAGNNVAYGPFTRASFPRPWRSGGVPVPAEYLASVRRLVAAASIPLTLSKGG